MRSAVVALLLLVASHVAAGQSPADSAGKEPIRDNSFLIEEAFNQPAGVVQHIVTAARSRDRTLALAFSQEWPVRGVRNQLSYSIPMIRSGTGSETGIGDVGLHYRYQLVGATEGPWFMAPRASVILPTGDANRGMGAGGTTIEGMLPTSMELAKLTLTTNVGGSITPRARAGAGSTTRDVSLRAGGSAIWAMTRSLNLLMESLWTQSTVTQGSTRLSRDREFVISPGVRWARDLASGMQIVPGLAFPMQVGTRDGDRSVFVYFSVEHSFQRLP